MRQTWQHSLRNNHDTAGKVLPRQFLHHPFGKEGGKKEQTTSDNLASKQMTKQIGALPIESPDS
jgi:hypothetical protein